MFERMIDRLHEGPLDDMDMDSLDEEDLRHRNHNEELRDRHRNVSPTGKRGERETYNIEHGLSLSGRDNFTRCPHVSPPSYHGVTEHPPPTRRHDTSGTLAFRSAETGSSNHHFAPKHIRYDGTTPLTTYITRVRTMARRFNDQLVLDNLPLAMEGLAARWLDSLPEALISMIDHDLELWFH